MIKRHTLTVKVKIEMRKEADDSFVATCPQLGCIFIHEETEEAAYRHASDAIESYFLTSIKHNDPIPDSVVVKHDVQTERPRLPAPSQVPSISTLEVTRDLAVAV